MNYQKITKYDTANGIGIRTTLWVSGCNHHCNGCHNSCTWSIYSGKQFDNDALFELVRSLNDSHITGLTLSGGDPLHPENRNYIAYLVPFIKYNFPKKDIWLYTGYTLEELLNSNDYRVDKILSYIDILVDGEYKEELKDISYPWAGSSNQHIWKHNKDSWEISEYERSYRDAKGNAPIQK